jgi:hypothetical protein
MSQGYRFLFHIPEFGIWNDFLQSQLEVGKFIEPASAAVACLAGHLLVIALPRV